MEVTISVAIVAFTFVGMMSLFSYNLKLEIQSRNRIIASYLAQEAIEIVRQRRDSNWFAGQSTWSGIVKGNGNVIAYLPDTDNVQSGWSLAVSNNEGKKKVYLYNGNYVQENNSSFNADSNSIWKATPFTRSLFISDETDGFGGSALGGRIKVVVTVGYGAAQPLVVTSYLYDGWY